ncbi:hypothetical protein PIB30_015571 [Stylosanthes scabra]|uniref:Uncharacterized protein n=1 Tax=Stylosanthes scabra TaxID=79078 RepID=A0ABU6Q6Z5_9FABA|nr:hypothetical protein [Stylosanthes scabra]
MVRDGRIGRIRHASPAKKMADPLEPGGPPPQNPMEVHILQVSWTGTNLMLNLMQRHVNAHNILFNSLNDEIVRVQTNIAALEQSIQRWKDFPNSRLIVWQSFHSFGLNFALEDSPKFRENGQRFAFSMPDFSSRKSAYNLVVESYYHSEMDILRRELHNAQQDLLSDCKFLDNNTTLS